MPPPRPEPPSVRYSAYVIWGALLLSVILVSIVAALVGPGLRGAMGSPFPGSLAVAAAGVNVVLLAGSRFFPRILPEGATPLTKTAVSTAICEAGAVFAAVAWMLTGNRHSLAGLIMGLSGIAICFPNDIRWRELGGTVEGDVPARDRSDGSGFSGR
jgi:hypothetical protein